MSHAIGKGVKEEREKHRPMSAIVRDYMLRHHIGRVEMAKKLGLNVGTFDMNLYRGSFGKKQTDMIFELVYEDFIRDFTNNLNAFGRIMSQKA